jgi:hypothetical protein
MGSHGTSGIEEMVIGSNTEKNSTPLKNPVLSWSKKQSNFNNFVFASDFSENKNLSKNGRIFPNV